MVRTATQFTINLASDLENIEEFKRGDQVTVMYREEVTFQVKKLNQAKPGVAHTTEVIPALSGQKPGASMTDTVHMRALIATVDKEVSIVGIRDRSGHPRPKREHRSAQTA